MRTVLCKIEIISTRPAKYLNAEEAEGKPGEWPGHLEVHPGQWLAATHDIITRVFARHSWGRSDAKEFVSQYGAALHPTRNEKGHIRVWLQRGVGEGETDPGYRAGLVTDVTASIRPEGPERGCWRP